MRYTLRPEDRQFGEGLEEQTPPRQPTVTVKRRWRRSTTYARAEEPVSVGDAIRELSAVRQILEKEPRRRTSRPRTIIQRNQYEPKLPQDSSHSAISQTCVLITQRTWLHLRFSSMRSRPGPSRICSKHCTSLTWKPGRN